MTEETRRFIAISRWLTPLCITLIGVAIFGQRNAPGVPQLYGQQVNLLFVCVMLWAGAAWWCACNARRFLRLYERLQQQRLLLPGVLIFSALALLDFSTLLLQDLFPLISRHFFLLSSLSIFILALLTFLLSARHPATTLRYAALTFSVIGVLLLFCELIFRIGMAEHVVPQTSREFAERIASQWPRPIAIAKPSDALRIIGLGGAFGKSGGEGNYYRLLETDLQRQIPKTELLNFSMEGLLLAQSADMFMRFGTQYQPDIVLHSLFIGRDLWGDPSVDLLSYRGIPLEKKRNALAWTPHNFLLRQWLIALCSSTFAHADQAGISYELRWKPRERMEICRKDLPLTHPEIWKTAGQLLDNLARVTQNYHARYILIIHPDQFQVEPRIVKEMKETRSLALKDFDFQQPQRLLLEYCHDRGIACLDLLPAFQEQGNGGGLYAPDGLQYSETGHRLVANEIERFLAATQQSDAPEAIVPPTPEIVPTPTPIPTPTPAPAFKIRDITVTDETGAPLSAVDDIYTINVGETLTISVNVENSASQNIIGHWSALHGDIQDTSALTNRYTASKSGVDFVIIAVEDASTGDTYEEPINITVQ
ncbi:hypothetical protein U14_05405 [Candidatus Moduliflexus flocculans]|uniref:SGNH/GDSL hydrolase family protein n=1 Tax=Candidatus Moduliflexus flocculans TaxID=1499966 RepID=A0A081BRU6_9BACT|nr:hypothetical protein U14_05405 [Candidatus Moduliflexus flocculans]